MSPSPDDSVVKVFGFLGETVPAPDEALAAGRAAIDALESCRVVAGETRHLELGTIPSASTLGLTVEGEVLLGSDRPPARGLLVYHVDRREADELDAGLGSIAHRLGWSLAVTATGRVLAAPPRSRSAPVVRVGLLQRREGMTTRAFEDHWIDRHAPLVLASTPGFGRYEANIGIVGATLDGIVEQWFADPSALDGHDRLDEPARAAVGDDVKSFVGRLQTYLARPWGTA